MRDSHSNLDIFEYEDWDLARVLADVHNKYGAEHLTIQSGGNMNGQFLRDDLIDYVNVVVAPVLVGGRDTSTLIDGEAISSPEELDKIRSMKLIECKALNDSYVQLRYEVIHR
jgi:2,5-diamino-6-(ribosylamino)-4(3H)-pyrimidinone 5'-phosphate reductase